MRQLQHFIKGDKYSHSREGANAPAGDYFGGAAYQYKQVKNRGKAKCTRCGKIMHNVPKGWADECYECRSKNE